MARSCDLAIRSGRRKSKGTTFLAGDSCAWPPAALLNNASISCCDKVRFKRRRPDNVSADGQPTLINGAQTRTQTGDERVGERTIPRSRLLWIWHLSVTRRRHP